MVYRERAAEPRRDCIDRAQSASSLRDAVHRQNLSYRAIWRPALRRAPAAIRRCAFDLAAGRPVVLSFLGSMQMPGVRQAVEHILTRHRSWFDDKQACFFGVGIDPADEQAGLLRDAMPGIRFFRTSMAR